MIEVEEVKEMLVQEFPEAEIRVTDLRGTRDHFRIEIKSGQFKGKSLIDQHRMVKEPLKKAMELELIHAVEIKTSV